MRLIQGMAHATESDQMTDFPKVAAAITDPSVSWGPCRAFFRDGII